MKSKELTRAEEQVMQYLWSIEKGFLKDIVEKFPDPKPAYTTVSTVIRVLVKKKFIGFNTYGKINEYFPLVSRNSYFQTRLKPIITNYFSGSTTQFASYFANEQLNLSELEEMRLLIEERIKKLKTKKK
jgi:BlaI family transcriptional regulator, penicillinase repressor